MYTWEIEKYLILKNYLLTGKEYLKMIESSPQVKKVKYNANEDNFEIWTEENNSMGHFKFKVKKITK